MELHRESRGLSRGRSAREEGTHASERTRSPLGSPSLRGALATPAVRRARPFRLLLLAGLALAACEPYVQGNGVFLEEDRSSRFGPFEGIHVEDGIQATVTAGAAAQSVLVSGDANLVQNVKTELRDEMVRGAPTKVLHVSVDVKDFDPTIPVRAVVKVDEIRYVFASDAARLTVGAAAAVDMVVEARGGSTVLLGGPGGTALHATLDDAALDAGSYPVEFADVTLTTRSRVELHADGAVTGSAQGGSEVDNLLGGGNCAGVTVDASSTLQCQPGP